MVDAVYYDHGITASVSEAQYAEAVRIITLCAAAPDMAERLLEQLEALTVESDDMLCDAGNPDGGSEANCLHCHTRRTIARIEETLVKAGVLAGQ